MRKEIAEKVEEFKRKEADLRVAIMKDSENEELLQQMTALKLLRRAWLEKIGGFTLDLDDEKTAKLKNLVEAAEERISTAASINANLLIYIDYATRGAGQKSNNYDRIVEDNGQLETLAQEDACKRVRALDKFNRKNNKKSFINFVECKFKKTKTQEQSQERSV